MLTDILELHFVECPKFRSQPFDISDPLHRWLRFLEQNTSKEQLEEFTKLSEEQLLELKASMLDQAERDASESERI